MWANNLTLLAIVALLIVPIVLQYVFGYFDKVYDTIHVSLYGIYLIVYLIIQIVFSALNNVQVPKRAAESRSQLPMTQPLQMTNVIVVGYRENAEYFRKCLESVKKLATTSNQVNKVIVVIDGNESDDYYMVGIFQGILGGLYIENRLTEEANSEQVRNSRYICISQAHEGKRVAMKVAFDISVMDNQRVQTVLCTDSDTVLEASCVEELMPLFEDDNVGAVAGNLGIYTKYDSVIAFLSYLRYWFAFNVERGYQSFNKNVLCVSGPIGMYRLKDVVDVKDEWVQQKFLSQLCTYGDDRHLTNMMIAKGKSVIYTPAAKANTETPATIERFYRQQTRWSKSAYREFLWAINNVSKTRIMMMVDLVYLLVFPFIVMGYLMYILWGGTLEHLQKYVIVVSIGSLVKTLYGVCSTRQIQYMFYLLYIVPYACVIFPCKLWALATLRDMSWGSGVRKAGAQNNTRRNFFKKDIVFLYAWNVMMLSGLAYNISTNIQSIKHVSELAYLVGIVAAYAVMLVGVYCYVTYKRKSESKERVE